MSRGILVFVLTSLVVSPALTGAGIEVIRDPNAWDFAPLLYSDKVLRGTVVETRQGKISSSDLWMLPPGSGLEGRTAVVNFITIDVLETLRGEPTRGRFEFMVYKMGDPSPVPYAIGVEMLVCVKLHTRLGLYYHGSDYARYTRDSDMWRSGPTARGDRSFADAEIRQCIAEMDLPFVVDNAELIVVGTVVGKRDSTVTDPDAGSAQLVTLTLRVEKVKKGEVPGDLLDVVMLTRGMYLPAWRKHVPTGYEADQRWLCFLRYNEFGWYPFAGTNGLFELVPDPLTYRDQLIYDERVEYWHTLERVDEAISAGRSP